MHGNRDSGILSVSVARLIDAKNITTNACARVLTPASTLYAEFAIRASIVYHETAHNWLSIAYVARITESGAAAVYLGMHTPVISLRPSRVIADVATPVAPMTDDTGAIVTRLT
jgi:hypothetical protein